MQRRDLLRLLGAGAAQAWLGCGSPDSAELGARVEALGAGDGGAACAESARVVVLGGGVSGMTVAHELAERGFEVSVYELRTIPGGKARSMGKPHTGVGGRFDLPGEHGFRFFPGFYRHLPDTMRRIPRGDGRSVFDCLVPASRFLLSQAGKPDAEMPIQLRDGSDLWAALVFLFGPNVTGVPLTDLLFFFGRIERWLKSCDARRFDEYERTSWWDYVEGAQRSEPYRKFVASGLTRTLVAAKGEHMSARSAAQVFVQLIQDVVGGGQAMDRVLDGPTSEVWLEPWLAHLQKLGVQYHADARVVGLECQNGRVAAAHVSRDGVPCRVTGELFVSALPVEVLRELVTPDLLALEPKLAGLSRLHTEWMNGIQFFLDRDVAMVRGHATFFDSPWALTAIAPKQFWPNVDLARYGDGTVRGVLSVDVSDWNTPGILFGKPARACTEAEIRDEVWAQLSAHWDDTLGSQFRAARVVDVHLDPAIVLGAAEGARNEEPLLVNTVGSWYDRPEATTAIPNLFLAGDYVRTRTDLATMESANESARRAVNGVLRATHSRARPAALYTFDEPPLYALARLRDELRYALGLPPP